MKNNTQLSFLILTLVIVFMAGATTSQVFPGKVRNAGSP